LHKGQLFNADSRIRFFCILDAKLGKIFIPRRANGGIKD
jgi:hypothetical protein